MTGFVFALLLSYASFSCLFWLLWCPVCKLVVYNVLDDPCSWPCLCFFAVYISLLVEVGRIGWRKRYTLLFFLLFLAFIRFFFLFPLILAIHVSVCFLVVLRSWLPFHPFATHPYDCHDCPVRRYVYAISLFCLDFVSSLPLFCDIRQPVDLLCLMTLCSTVPFALFVVPIPCLIWCD